MRSRIFITPILVALTCLTMTSVVHASPVWSIDSLANTSAAPGSTVAYYVQVTNIGDEAAPPAPAGDATNCEPGGAAPANCYTIAGSFPAGLTPLKATFHGRNGDGLTVPCEVDPGTGTFACRTPAYQANEATSRGDEFSSDTVLVEAEVTGAAGTLTPTFSVQGGGASNTAATARPTLVSATPPPFGLSAFDDRALDALGGPSTVAAGHPSERSTSLEFNTFQSSNPEIGFANPVEPPRNIDVELPAGFLGDPSGADTCTLEQLMNGPFLKPESLCSTGSQIGIAWLRYKGNINAPGLISVRVPVFNMVPYLGFPASFGFDLSGVVVLFDAKVRAGSDYGVSVLVHNASEALGLAGSTVDIWGVPSAASHDGERVCPGKVVPWRGGPSCASSARPSAFFRNPTRCVSASEGLISSAHIDSWVHGGARLADGEPDLSDPAWKSASFVSHEMTGYPYPLAEWGPTVGLEGCASIPFEPQVSAVPTSESADSPTGLTFQLTVPQDCWSGKASVREAEEAVCQSDLKQAAVSLPAGVTVNPAAASALGACTQAEFALHSGLPAHCPDDSKIGKVTVDTPLLGRRDAQGKPVLDGEGNVVPEPLEGSVYLAQQGDNPFGSLLAIYLVAEGSGVVVKQAGHVILDPGTGQLKTVFDEVPQQPFSKLSVELFGGDRAPLRTPGACGSYATTADLTPWSGNPAVQRSSSLQVSQGCGGGGFAPKLTAGTQNPAAGQTSPFVLRLSREDGEGAFASVATTLPQGLTGYLKGIPRCSDQALTTISSTPGTGASQVAGPSCPAGSLLGSVTVGVGAGPDPYYDRAGRVYLAGPYQGAPFSLAIVTPAVAGPFDLGNVLVRAGIYVDPNTAQVTVKSGRLPTILEGIPLDIRSIEVNIDRPGFMLNATSCEPMSIGTSIASTTGATVTPAIRYQASDCAGLKFKPSFTASTQGKTSRREGASLDVKVSYPLTGQANIAKVHVSLPKQLPSRTDTLKLACLDSVFNANPATCPDGSRIGTATALTPILSSPLTGPAYLVSHGGAAFPDLEIVLQGEGVTIILDGKTDIKNGVTSSSFETVPDQPISSFELKLPEGPHSILAAPDGNLCSQNLAMPTTIQAQDGAQVTQSTQIEVEGCPYSLLIRSRRVRNHTLTLQVSVPGAGKLTARAKGLRSRSASSARRSTLTLKLPESKTGKLRTKVLISFTPKAGKQRTILRKSITVTFH